MFRRRTVCLAALAAIVGCCLPATAAAGAASSGASAPASSEAGATTGTTTTPPASAVAPSATLYLPGLFDVQHGLVTVPGRAVRVGGVVRPYVAGQTVMVRAYLDGHLFKSRTASIARAGAGRYGHFSVRLSSPRVGDVTVTVTHVATPQMLGWKIQRRFAALDEHVTFGATGRFVELIQQRLAALHFYVPQTGVYDQGTGLALDAYHRVLRWGEGNESLDGRTISFLLDGFGAFKVRYPDRGNHAEGDLAEQVLALIKGSRVSEIFPISSGKPSTPTILGDFRVYSKVPGYLPDGMYYSNFFIRGYAIHGYDPAPDYPASHGCMRLPIVDAITVYNWLQIGNWVDVYY